MFSTTSRFFLFALIAPLSRPKQISRLLKHLLTQKGKQKRQKNFKFTLCILQYVEVLQVCDIQKGMPR